MPAPFVATIDLQLASKLRAILEEKGFVFTQPPHTLFQAKQTQLTCTLYASGKLVVQGKGMEELITYVLEPEILGTFTYTHPSIDLTSRIGVDESGKGDFFGPLCVAAVFASGDQITHLQKIGVKDSKCLSDPTILILAKQVATTCPHTIVTIGPERYNTLYRQFGNLNLLLGWGHATAIDELLKKVDCALVVIDKFAAEHVVETALKRKNRSLKLEQRTKGEQDVVVAAASILARASFVNGMHALSKRYGLELPKGASALTIAAGKKFVSTHGQEALPLVAKIHFKTTLEILGS